MPIKSNLIKTEKDKSLSKLNYRKKDIWWFFQWLKVTVDLEGKNLEFNKSRNIKHNTSVSKKDYQKKVYGTATGTIKKKVTITAFKNMIDLKEIKSMKPIIDMTDKERFKYMNKMFEKYKHLFGDFTIKYSKSAKEIKDDDNYFIVQIPKSKNRVDIDRELERIKQIHKIESSRFRAIEFSRGVVDKEMKKLWGVWVRKNKEGKWQGKKKMLNNSEIANQVGYGGFRSVQLANISAKNMILNIAKGIFPKNTI